MCEPMFGTFSKRSCYDYLTLGKKNGWGLDSKEWWMKRSSATMSKNSGLNFFYLSMTALWTPESYKALEATVTGALPLWLVLRRKSANESPAPPPTSGSGAVQQQEGAFPVRKSQEKVHCCWAHTAYLADTVTPNSAPSNTPGTSNEQVITWAWKETAGTR